MPSITAVAATALVVALSTSAASLTLAATEEKRILNCPADKNKITIDDCDPIGYGATAGVTLVAPLLLAYFTFMVIPYFYCARYCCKCCGSSKQTDGCCCACGAESGAPARYSWFEILRVKIYAVICAVVSIVMLVFGMVAAAKSKTGISEFLDAIAGVGKVLVDEIDLIGKELTVRTYNINTDTFTDTNLLLNTSQGRELKYAVGNVSDDIEKIIKDGAEPAKSGLDVGSTILFIIVLLPCLCMFLNVVFAFFNIRKWGPMLTGFFTFFFLILVWLAHGVVGFGGIVVSDLCAEISGLANQEKNVVSAFIECPTALLNEARDAFRELEKSEALKACRRMNDTCVIPTSDTDQFARDVADGRIFDCPEDFLNCTNPTFSRLLNYTENVMSINDSVYDVPNAQDSGYVCRNTSRDDCTIARCAEKCTFENGTRSEVGKSSALAITTFRAASTVASVFADIGARFYVCDSLLSLVFSKMSGPCQDTSDGFYQYYMASGVIALFSIVTIYVSSWGNKRFIPFSEAGKLQRDLDDGDQRPTQSAIN